MAEDKTTDDPMMHTYSGIVPKASDGQGFDDAELPFVGQEKELSAAREAHFNRIRDYYQERYEEYCKDKGKDDNGFVHDMLKDEMNREWKGQEGLRLWVLDRYFHKSDREQEIVQMYGSVVDHYEQGHDEEGTPLASQRLDEFRQEIAKLDLADLVFLHNYIIYKYHFKGVALGFDGEKEMTDDYPVSRDNIYLWNVDSRIREIAEGGSDDRDFVSLDELKLKTPEDERKRVAPNARVFQEVLLRYQKYFDDEGDARSNRTQKGEEGVESSSNHVNFARTFSFLERFAPGAAQRIQFQVSGNRVLDLGSGSENALLMAREALKMGATEYVGVDKYHMAKSVNEFGKENDIACVAVKEDMLEFIVHEDPESSVILINGIDETIFDEENQQHVVYLEKLCLEIARVAKGKSIIGINSNIIFDRLKPHGYQLEELDFGSSQPVCILRYVGK